MKITFVLPMYLSSPSGGFKVVYEYANRLQLRGHQITVIHPRNEITSPGVVEYLKSRAWNYKMRASHHPLIPWFEVLPEVELRLVPDLQERFIPDADVIFATAYNTAFHVAQYSERKGRKLYLVQSYESWGGSDDVVEASWRLPLYKIVISGWLFDKAKELDEKNQVTRVPIGLDFSAFKITLPLEERQVPRVGMLAHPSENKGMRDGLQALALAKEKKTDLQAIIFGTFPRTKEMLDWVEYVQQPSPGQLLNLYNSCQVFLSPSWIEGWGLPAAEAMACGCALVSARNGGVNDFATDGETALLVPIQQPSLLAEALLKLLTNRSLRLRVAQAGHHQIQTFTWENAVNSLENLLMTR